MTPNEPLKSYECPNCGKVMNNDTEIKEHEMKHHQKFPRTPKPQSSTQYKCDQCPSKLESADTLNKHIESVHEEASSPLLKKTKVDVEEEAVNKMKTLTMSEKNKVQYDNTNTEYKDVESELMDIDIEKKRKQEESVKGKTPSKQKKLSLIPGYGIYQI